MQKTFTAIGLMSGTSMDGIDAALITTDGVELCSAGVSHTFPYPDIFRNKLRQLIAGNGDISSITTELTHLHAKAVASLLSLAGKTTADIDLIGFHGHTIDHRPHDGITLQIGDGAMLCRLTGISVVNDFRSNDVKSGGQGAPLVPVFHRAIMAAQKKPVAVVNIGGVANVTWIGEHKADLLAFDTGPGNALLDDWVHLKTGKNFDAGGQLAKSGAIDERLLMKLLNNSYFTSAPPKSLDRNQFAGIAADYPISAANGAATLAAFTAKTIADSANFFPAPVCKWLISGGGRHNAAIMDYLHEYITQPIENIDQLGLSGDMLEAQAFAFLAVRSVLGLPLSFPGTTGVKNPVTGGILHNQN